MWSERLAWDYRASTDLLLQYLDARVLPGFVAVEDGRVIGYAFCVYEERKAIVGDVFAVTPRQPGLSSRRVEEQLLEHLLALLTHSPGVERIESQLLLHAHDQHTAIFQRLGFEVHGRVFMERHLGRREDAARAAAALAPELAELDRKGFLMRSWLEADFSPAGSFIAAAYLGHLDSIINDQYRSVAGSLRFLHNIIRFPGCGLFDPQASRVVERKETGEMVAILLCSRVRQDVGHVTQACVAHGERSLGLGSLMLSSAMAELAGRGFTRLSLTVTEENRRAAALYRRLGFVEQHWFDAMVWTAKGRAGVPAPGRLGSLI